MPTKRPAKKSTDGVAIRRLIENWAKAVRKRDLPGILAHHSPQILMFDVPPPFSSKGIKAYKKTWDYFFKAADYAGVFEIDHLEITAGPDVAFAAAVMRCGTPDQDGPNGQLAFRLTIGLRKIAGQWTIFHEHHSIPAT